ncbi:Hypothetical protein OINT_1000586 [Brucella intermedia LMG 3301]|uniref:Uncharacterized protein n=1 Tax=Brucella intermedia LMG 3301 TaxID=641118 RepID=C4WJK2_9HYPH|nr:Hypothetical protein OINT_1000586 [Brucella intermedia LMG 3301]
MHMEQQHFSHRRGIAVLALFLFSLRGLYSIKACVFADSPITKAITRMDLCWLNRVTFYLI